MDPHNTMHITITGATGLLGSNLAALLCAQGHTVTCTKRASSKTDHLQDLDVSWPVAPLDDVDALTEAFRGADVVFHCAAAVSIQRKPTPHLIQTNVKGTENVIQATRNAGAKRLVHCSSTVAIGLSEDGRPSTEHATWNFNEHNMDDGYCITKYQSEQRALRAAREGLDVVVINPGYMFGPRDIRPSSGKMILDLIHKKVPGVTYGRNSFVDVRDVAQGMIAAAEHGKSGERYILAGENITYAEVMKRIADVAGVKAPTISIPRPVGMLVGWGGELQQMMTGNEPLLNVTSMRYAFCPDFIFDSQKARDQLGYTTRPLEDSIRDAIDWFRAHNMLSPS